ncbi:MAG TPA: sugar transferase [Candidatus Eremiobacteraceae bacterium]|nr:sugar transferase [Candidatus Eremiobacteraceae bacterium]
MIASVTAHLPPSHIGDPKAAERIRYWQKAQRSVPGAWTVTKRAIDVGVGALLLALTLPLLCLIALAIKIVSPGPALFSQSRVGKNGQLFVFYKFRTMVDGAHLLHNHVAHLNEADGPALKIANDPRLHALGAFLRRSSLDELPQLWNVLRGDMSLVGPRPALPDEVTSYLPHYHQRLTVQPGMTGLWQVSGRANVPFRRWMAMDVWYARHWSPVGDIWILVRTLPAVLGREGAW